MKTVGLPIPIDLSVVTAPILSHFVASLLRTWAGEIETSDATSEAAKALRLFASGVAGLPAGMILKVFDEAVRHELSSVDIERLGAFVDKLDPSSLAPAVLGAGVPPIRDRTKRNRRR